MNKRNGGLRPSHAKAAMPSRELLGTAAAVEIDNQPLDALSHTYKSVVARRWLVAIIDSQSRLVLRTIITDDPGRRP